MPRLLTAAIVALVAFGPHRPIGSALQGAVLGLLQPSDFTYKGYWDVQLNGKDSPYAQGLAVRYVGPAQRFVLYDAVGSDPHLKEFSVAGLGYGGAISTTTNSWPAIHNDGWLGLWYEQSSSRLFTVSSIDYGSASTYYSSAIYTYTLNNDGTFGTTVGPVQVQNVGSKQLFGGFVAIPTSFQTTYGVGPYGIGFGGGTGLFAQATKASLGTGLFAIPDPSPYGNNGTIPAANIKELTNDVSASSRSCDWYSGKRTFDRGVRLASEAPTNYLDGGDNRGNPIQFTGTVDTSGTTVTIASGGSAQKWWPGYNGGPAYTATINGSTYTVASVTDATHFTLTTSAGTQRAAPFTSPPTRPNFAPLSSGCWQSPAPDGLGRFVWTDEYWNTGNWISGAHKQGYVAIASLAGGKVWYTTSTISQDSRVFELHIFDPATLGEVVRGKIAPYLATPASMTALTLPGLGAGGMDGTPVLNVGSAVFDSKTSHLYLLGCGVNTYFCRLYDYAVSD